MEQLLGYKKLNTSAYHPQTDGLVERFNRTLTAMLAKTVERGGKNWDQQLPFVLFAYRASQQQSTLESPFFLLYGRDPRLPTDCIMQPRKARRVVDLREYGADLASHMGEAWDLARQCIHKAQKKQKHYYDKKARPPNFRVGDRVFLFKPAEKTGPLRKFARPYHGPFRVMEMDVNIAKIRRVDKSEEDAILVAVDRLRRCPSEVSNEFWPPAKLKGKRKKVTDPSQVKVGIPTTAFTQDEDLDTDLLLSDVTQSSGPSTQKPDSEEAGVFLGPHWSDVNEVTSGPDEKKGNEQHTRDMDQDTSQLTVKTNNGKWAHCLRRRPQRCSLEDD